MSSTVRSRPNHYETLGLGPTATDDEITKAFVRRMSPFVPRPMAAAAQISAAYETLRNPTRRRAYDASLGLGRDPRHPVTAEPANETRFVRPAPADPVERPAIDTPPRPAPRLKPQARSETLPERRMGSFIAESLREPVEPDARDSSPGPAPQREPPKPSEARPVPIIEPDLADLLADRWAARDGSRGAEDRPTRWVRNGAAVGALVLAVGLLGALAGWQRGDGDEPQQAERAVSIALPLPQVPKTAVPSPAPTPDVLEPRPKPSITAKVAAAPKQPQPPPQQSFVSEDKQPEITQSAESQAEEGVAARAAAQAPPAQTVAANLPLPNAVIARTIERIGYSCGEVASATAVEGKPSGVYKVTCTSGQSYQATPVRGRYHFRRLGNR